MSATGRMWRHNWRLDSRNRTRSSFTVSPILDSHEVYSVGMADLRILWGW